MDEHNTQQIKRSVGKVETPDNAVDLDVLKAVLAATDETITPWETVVLPSLGEYYDGAVPGGVVEVQAWGIDADKILSTARLVQTGQSIDHIFKRYVRFPSNPDFDHHNLLLGDRNFLLYYLRGITHSNEYEFFYECGNSDCGKGGSYNYDLNELIGTVKRPNLELGEEPFEVVLPHLSEVTGKKFWVKVRLMRGYDTNEMFNRMRKKKSSKAKGPSKYAQKQSADDIVEQNLHMVIIEAMGTTDKTIISQLVGKLHAKDTAVIREFLERSSPGIDTTVTLECEHCAVEMKVLLPITPEFFQPKKS